MINNRLTKFEKAKIIGQRATQIALGAPPLVDITGLSDAIEIAEKEHAEHKIPFMIKRDFPNHKSIILKLYK